jgi:molybdate transport system substrate-binding protein
LAPTDLAEAAFTGTQPNPGNNRVMRLFLKQWAGIMKRTKTEDQLLLNRRTFLTTAAGAAAGATIPSTLSATPLFHQSSLQVWACGGLAEAFIPANNRYKEKTGVSIAFTGAFAAALGKSLMGSASTEVFAGRVLALAQKLRKADKMTYFKPLCFTSYVLVTPKGNPAGISSIQDLAKPGIRVLLAPDASPPGGEAVTGLLKKAGILDQAMKNAVIKGSCVQRTMEDLVKRKGDVSIVEKRLTRMPLFKGKTEVLPIPEAFFPPGPLTFTIGVMKNATDKALADHFVDFILSEEGQGFLESAGFIPAASDEGHRLVEKLGVKDV